MATGGEQGQLSESTCSVCFEHYRLPKVLPCSHLYCHLCLRSMATATATDSGFSCPICRQEVNITAQGVDALQTHLTLRTSSETATSTPSVEKQDEQNPHISTKSDSTSTNPPCGRSAITGMVRVRKHLPKELYKFLWFSNNSKTVLSSLTLSTENKLWVQYQPPGNLVHFLSVYDTGGKLLGRYTKDSVKGSSLTCLGDVLLSPLTWRWIDTQGRSGRYNLFPNDWALCSKSLPPHILLRTSVPSSGMAAFSVYCLLQVPEDGLAVTMCPVITEGLSFDREPYVFDISVDGRWLAFLIEDRIEMYYADCTSARPLSKTRLKPYVVDIAFTTLGSEPVLAAASRETLWIFNFEDGFIKLKCIHNYG